MFSKPIPAHRGHTRGPKHVWQPTAGPLFWQCKGLV